MILDHWVFRLSLSIPIFATHRLHTAWRNQRFASPTQQVRQPQREPSPARRSPNLVLKPLPARRTRFRVSQEYNPYLFHQATVVLVRSKFRADHDALSTHYHVFFSPINVQPTQLSFLGLVDPNSGEHEPCFSFCIPIYTNGE